MYVVVCEVMLVHSDRGLFTISTGSGCDTCRLASPPVAGEVDELITPVDGVITPVDGVMDGVITPGDEPMESPASVSVGSKIEIGALMNALVPGGLKDKHKHMLVSNSKQI